MLANEEEEVKYATELLREALLVPEEMSDEEEEVRHAAEFLREALLVPEDAGERPQALLDLRKEGWLFFDLAWPSVVIQVTPISNLYHTSITLSFGDANQMLTLPVGTLDRLEV
jgi:hypothetical protein